MSLKPRALFVLMLISKVFFAGDCKPHETEGKGERPVKKSCERLISLAPSITEMLFALNLGNQVVGVTRYCRYPAAARKITQVGGFTDTNYESAISLKPGLVFALPFHQKQQAYLRKLNQPVVQLQSQSLEQIRSSIRLIGTTCDREPEAKALLAKIKKRTLEIQQKLKDRPVRRVLVAVSHSVGADQMHKLYILGRKSFYTEMLEEVRGRNVYQDDVAAFPIVSREALMRFNPEVILDILPRTARAKITNKQVLDLWDTFPNLRAVKNKEVHIMDQEFVPIPGPRYIQTLELMARAVHPDVKWD